ncbi:MAG: GTPase Era [Flavobacteriaceae bacterium]|nr:GTPase Era [Flavobacteriaceae bacterium]
MKRCGYVSIIGKTNVGKSTFLNSLSGKKVSITSKTSQTTRSNIYTIKNIKNTQAIFIDTPGIHSKTNKAMNKILRKKPREVVNDVDLILFMISGSKFDELDAETLNLIKKSNSKKILLINKIDLVKDKSELFEFVKHFEHKEIFDSIIPLSALKNDGIDIVEKEIESLLPENDFFYDSNNFNFQSFSFEISEIIREKVIRYLGDELPYETAVQIESMNEKDDEIDINALILVSRQSQKKIVIGSKGEKIKQIGTSARKEIKEILKKKVRLELWCKVKKNWLNDPVTLESLGIKN